MSENRVYPVEYCMMCPNNPARGKFCSTEDEHGVTHSTEIPKELLEARIIPKWCPLSKTIKQWVYAFEGENSPIVVSHKQLEFRKVFEQLRVKMYGAHGFNYIREIEIDEDNNQIESHLFPKKDWRKKHE